MDLSKYKTAEEHSRGFECEIYEPDTGKSSGLVISAHGPDSPEFRKAMRKKMIMLSSEDGKEIDFETREAVLCQFLADITIGWSGIEIDGKPLEFSKAEALRVYAAYPFIANQLNAAANSYANFTKG